MLLCEALTVTPADMLLVVMGENKEELFDGLICEVGNSLAARPINGLGVFSDYSNCFQAVVAAPADLPTMLSVYDLMDFLQYGQVQAYQLTHSVGFPSLKVGAAIQIPKYLFIKWLEDQAKKQIL